VYSSVHGNNTLRIRYNRMKLTKAEIIEKLEAGCTLVYNIRGKEYVFTKSSLTPHRLWFVCAAGQQRYYELVKYDCDVTEPSKPKKSSKSWSKKSEDEPKQVLPVISELDDDDDTSTGY
jgi:hypothetical protein